MHLVLEFTKNLIPVNWKTTGTGWTSGNCPMCVQNGQSRPDTKKRGGFYFEEDKFRYNCFNCGYSTGWSEGKQLSGRLKRLYGVFGADSSEIHRLQIELMRERDTAELLIKKKTEDKEVKIDWPEIPLPSQTQDLHTAELSEKELPKFVSACEFLSDRSLLDYPDWKYSTFSHFKSRVILPFYYKGKVVGYTARWVGDVPNKETPKYYVQQPKNFVYGLDNQHAENRFVIVTEGVFDAILVDGISVLGNGVTAEQAHLIDKLNKRVILCPDRDNAGKQLIDRAVELGWEVSFPPWKDSIKDAADAVTEYGRLLTVNSIVKFATNNKIKIQVQRKML